MTLDFETTTEHEPKVQAEPSDAATVETDIVKPEQTEEPAAEAVDTTEQNSQNDTEDPANGEEAVVSKESDPEKYVHMEIDVLRVVNYALLQNGLHMIRSVRIVNEGDEPIENAELRITAQPEFCLSLTRPIDYLPAHKVFTDNGVRLSLDGNYLAGLTEKLTGTIQIELWCKDELLCSQQIEITALAFDEWHGLGLFPELLCAFVTPNHPEIAKITARAAELLGGWTGDPSLDAYQSDDRNRVLKQAAAIYGALQEQNIVYCVPPASFESAGQRVRLCDTVMQQKLGTCLDLSLLYAAALEAIGLHPLLILKPGHIFAGLWLEDMCFAESVQDDASLLTKRLASGISEIAVVECTAFVAGKTITFDEAAALAEKQLTQAPIECFIDVSRARLSGIQPIPMRIPTEDGGWRVERPLLSEAELTAAPKEKGSVVTVEETEETPVTRKSRWERKLLDIGLRNALINLRLSKTLIPLLASSVDDLEDSLADGEDFSVLPRPTDWNRDSELSFDTMHELGPFASVIQSEFKNHRLRSALTEAELAKTIKELYRSAKSSLEENGANTLYLALGLLRWYENPRSTKPRYAPLILIPIEIVRKSAAQGYVIRLRDDEPQMNVTILEKLKQDFQIIISGLDILPEDEHGIDTRKVFTIVRKAVMEQKNWDVLESAYIGIFSFSQFVMWNDIRSRYDDLAKNKIVSSLMAGKLEWEAEEMSIGDEVDESGVFLPMSADASQLYAIKAASEGKSFVLHGPPGTGKSQTITALIANALAQGKTVLFVAEKMAALEVVEKRLDNIGIGDFCLELHSNKAKKKTVLEQLRKASEVTKQQTPQSYEMKADRIAKIREELSEYTHALHQTQHCGRSLYELINEYETNRDAPDLPSFDYEGASEIDRVKADEQEVLLQRVIAAAREIGHPQGHPLTAVKTTHYTQQMRMTLANRIETYRTALVQLRAAAQRFGETTQLPVGTYDQLETAKGCVGELKFWLHVPRAWAASEQLNIDLSRVQEMCDSYGKANKLAAELSQTWNPDFLTLDGRRLLEEYRETCAKWFLPRLLGLNALCKKLAPYAVGAVHKEQLEQHLSTLAHYRDAYDEGKRLFDQYGALLGDFYNGAQTNWEDINTCCINARESAKTLSSLSGTDDFRITYGGRSELREQIDALITAWSGIIVPRSELDDVLDTQAAVSGDWTADQIAACEAVTQHFDELKEWITWNAIAEEADRNGLGCVIDAYQSGMAHEDITSAYHKALSRTLAMQAIDASPVLSGFSGAVFNEKIEQFRKMDKELTLLTQQEIYCRLAAKVPNFAREAAQSSELGILQKAIRSGGRGLSIRKLFDQIPNMLPRLCPCMLMSPISAAQYLAPNREPFDLVVFDEASQITTSKAVGALARGKNAVIVGDPKQMPPTSFFAVNTVDEDNIDDEDLESILDDCLALNMPQTHLLWHYRSRHESLIAFSNRHFYENKLYTFPSVNDREAKVRLIHTDGFFDRGKTRQNRAEAEAVIAELKRRCHDKKDSPYSVGVVTFNINQQNLIDDLLNEACKEDAALESWAYGRKEPVFIKNLENVQGDERDVILFSIGYGPDNEGKVSMNFGPLNRDGGWRRLNVAVSRARCEMLVFSTLEPDQINLNRTSAEGVAALRSFLEYASGRDSERDAFTKGDVREDTEGVSKAICAALAEQGYETQRMVGHSQYRIDIGVIDPHNPERYLLGILLDGSTYKASKTVRDRELAQISVLGSLGWTVTRVWAMDWWDNHQKELDRLLRLLKEAEEQSAAQASEEPEETEAEVSEVSPEVTTEVLTEAVAEPLPAETETLSNNVLAQTVPTESTPYREEYVAAVLEQTALSADEFVQPANLKTIRQRIETVLECEAPICESLLIRRVVQSFGITRSGSRIQNHMTAIIDSLKLHTTQQEGDRVFWQTNQLPEQYFRIRRNGEGINKRDVREIPVQEASNAVCAVLYEQISMSHDDLVREAAKLMNYTRLGSNVTQTFETAIGYADSIGLLILEDNGSCRLSDSGMTWAEQMVQNAKT